MKFLPSMAPKRGVLVENYDGLAGGNTGRVGGCALLARACGAHVRGISSRFTPVNLHLYLYFLSFRGSSSSLGPEKL